jgi:hypothetical protein
MSSELVTPAQAREVARQLFNQLHPGNTEWFELAWDYCRTRPQTLAVEMEWKLLPGLPATAAPDKVSAPMARQFAALAATFLIESALARTELLRRLRDAVARLGQHPALKEWLTRSVEEALTHTDFLSQTPQTNAAQEPQAYVVWEIGEYDVVAGNPMRCTEQDMNADYWSQRKNFDLFVRDQLVFAPKTLGDAEIQLHENERRLLVNLLINKGITLDPVQLYLNVFGKKSLVLGRSESDILQSHLKSALSRVRTPLKSCVPNFQIPDKRVFRGYTCKGDFSACVVIPASLADQFLLRKAETKPNAG